MTAHPCRAVSPCTPHAAPPDDVSDVAVGPKQGDAMDHGAHPPLRGAQEQVSDGAAEGRGPGLRGVQQVPVLDACGAGAAG